MECNNRYDNSSSKIRRIYIPLPNYKYFHKPSDIKDLDPRFVGRERIMKKLKGWLSNEGGNDAGSYLVTGYRGMGKSSFVGKVIKTLIDDTGERKEKSKIKTKSKIKLLLLVMPLLLVIIGLFSNDGNDINLCIFISVLIFLEIMIYFANKIEWIREKFLTIPEKLTLCNKVWIAIIVILIFVGICSCLKSDSFVYYFLTIVCLFLCLFLYVKVFFYSIKDAKEKYIHHITVNIGNEIKSERDVLALIVSAIQEKIILFCSKKIIYRPQYTIFKNVYYLTMSVVMIFLYNNSMSWLNKGFVEFIKFKSENEGLVTRLILSVNQILLEMSNNILLKMIFGILLSFSVSFVFVKYIVKPFFRFVLSQWGGAILEPEQIITQIKCLTDRINSFVDEDQNPYGAINSSSININLTQKKTKKYQPASVREIEEGLVNIINNIYDSILMNSRFIIVLDELDKIGAVCNSAQEQCENSVIEKAPEFIFDENGFSDEVSIHDKKRSILQLLGQMKFFTSSSKAKFVFIAGRELYDAFLADVSDREFSVSSIFNGVINIDSFFTCNSQTKDITKMTETYLCKLLIGNIPKSNNEIRDAQLYSLSKYADELRKRRGDKSTDIKSDEKKIIADVPQCEDEKLFAFLGQFITYLTFVSNGAPKKITSQIEQYIITKEEYNYQIKNENLSTSINGEIKYHIINPLPEKDENYYLAFGYYDQQKIGFIHYIAYPIFENIISPSSEYGDKLLVSSSFLIAHIYKHHNSGFSWRNLEYLPELIESNRTPELREYINSIIGYLGQIHLTAITSGIYSYKFPMKLVEEFSVYTKKSEEMSAIFNFSLDYSRAVKQYYYHLLNFHKKESKAGVAVANLHHYLGDIHMANDEYTEAITQFRLATDILNELIDEKDKDKEDNSTSTSLIVRYARAMLKLGLAYEKRNTIDSAYMVYSDLALRLVKHRDINEEELHLKYKIDNSKPERDFYRNTSILLYKNSDLYFDVDAPIFDRKTHPVQHYKDDDKKISYWIYGEELTDNLCDFLTPYKSILISKLSVFEDLRVAYLPILAKLFSIEKHNICGITKDNIKIAESEFKYLFLLTNSEDKYLLSVDFYRKLGDILYYKNKNFYNSDTLGDALSAWGYDFKPVIFNYCYQNNIRKNVTEKLILIFLNMELHKCVDFESVGSIVKQKIKDIELLGISDDTINKIIELIPDKIRKTRFNSICLCGKRRKERVDKSFTSNGCSACRYYNRSLTILKKNIIEDTILNLDITKAVLFINALRGNKLKSLRHNELTQAALSLDSMGNILLSCFSELNTPHENVISNTFVHTAFNNRVVINQSNSKVSKYTNIEKSLLYYLAAMEYHYKASNIKEGVQCLVKILNILSVYLRKNKAEWFDIGLINSFNDIFISEAIRKTYFTRDFNNVTETVELKNIENKNKINLGFTSIMSEIEELLIAFYEFAFHCKEYREKHMKILYCSPSFTYLRNESLTYNRIISLLFKQKMNEYYFEKLMKNNCKIAITKNNKCNKRESIRQYVNYFYGGSDNEIDEVSNELGVKPSDKNQLLEFIIADSILCLSNITDFISPTARTTLFTNSFCGGVYENLYKWTIRKEALRECSNIESWNDIQKIFIYCNDVQNCELCIPEKLRDEYSKNNQDESRFNFYEKVNYEQFDRYIKELIGESSYNILKTTHLREMAYKYYEDAIQINTEGVTYQNFIKGFYILDDDLQNNTCQFYLALERYKINIGDFRKTSAVSDNEYYKSKNYFKYPNESEMS